MKGIIDKNTWPETSFQQIYVRDALPGSFTERYVGYVLKGCYFGPKFTLEQIAKFSNSEKEKYPDAENIYQFYCGGYFTFNIADVILLDGEQFNAYKGKWLFGNKLDLGKKDKSWETWDPYMMELYIIKNRTEERKRLEAAEQQTAV